MSGQINHQAWGETTAFYQPIFSKEMAVIAHEALLRVRDLAGRACLPGNFLRCIEAHPGGQHDEMLRITGRILDVIRKDAAALRGRLSVNVSPAAMLNERIVEKLLTHEYRHKLIVEIIESPALQVMASDSFADACKALREAGTLVAIDDFGVEHSNLDRLAAIEADLVKVDMSFLCNRRGLSMLRHIAAMIRDVGAIPCIEGIETRQQLDAAIAAGFDGLQGYFLCPPAPVK